MIRNNRNQLIPHRSFLSWIPIPFVVSVSWPPWLLWFHLLGEYGTRQKPNNQSGFATSPAPYLCFRVDSLRWTALSKQFFRIVAWSFLTLTAGIWDTFKGAEKTCATRNMSQTAGLVCSLQGLSGVQSYRLTMGARLPRRFCRSWPFLFPRYLTDSQIRLAWQ